MENEIKVSIITPIYSSEYIETALKSLLNQTLKEIEVICVNDGSPDPKLPRILENYKKLDPRVVVINISNRGTGGARNAGIEAAKGEFIGFMDHDDFCEPDMYEKLYKNAIKNDADISMCEWDEFNEKTKALQKGMVSLKDRLDKNIYIAEEIPEIIQKIPAFVWVRIYRREFINIYNLRFPEIYWEDMNFTFIAFLTARKIVILNENLYHWRTNLITLSDDYGNKIKDMFETFERIRDTAISNDYYDKIRLSWFTRYVGWWIEFLNIKSKNLPESFKLLKQKANEFSLEEKSIYKLPDSTKIRYLDIKYMEFEDFIKKHWRNLDILRLLKSENDFQTFFESVCLKECMENLAQNLKNKNVIIYGAGLFTQKIFEYFDMSKLNIIAICDMKYNNIQTPFCGYKTIAPHNLPNEKADVILFLTYKFKKINKNLRNEIYKYSAMPQIINITEELELCDTAFLKTCVLN